MDILHVLDRPIAFQRSFVRMGAGITGALLLSQLIYWTNRTNADGWIYKTQEEWEEETGLTRYEQEGARKKLRGLGVLVEQKKGVPAKLYYRVDISVLYQLLGVTNKDEEIPHTSQGKTSTQAGGNSANIHTEITTETTTDIVSESADAVSPSEKIDYQKIMDVYHDTLPEMAQVKILTDARKKNIRNFWKKFKFNPERWEAYLRYIASNCRWMLEDRPNGHGGFWKRKNIDYLVTERCYVAVKEERANDQ
ncbi:replication protein [Pectobacteriaceae bacterium C52]|nr:replication protein [Pectobacteriaceae bacterium C52]